MNYHLLTPLFVLIAFAFSSCNRGEMDSEVFDNEEYSVYPESVHVEIGESFQLKLLVNHESEYTGDGIKWTSSDIHIASISETGMVTGLAVGETNVIAVFKGQTAICPVKVEQRYVEVSSISLNSYNHEMLIGDTFQLAATVLPVDATEKEVKWFSTEHNIVCVSETGLVTAIDEGVTTIYAYIGDIFSEACVIKVKNPIPTKEDEAANCHMVLPGGTVVFPANRGYSNNPLRDIVSTEVLWETFCRANNEMAKVGDVIKSVTYADGMVVVKTNNHDGNAVVAVLNDLGVILWSWHIWVTDYTADLNKGELDWYDGAYTYMMDRNLGALTNEPALQEGLGLYYQWGRKDPFYTSQWNSPRGLFYVSANRKWDSVSNDSKADLDYSIAHPMTAIERTGTGEWLPVSDNSLWNPSKGVYDPCPPGFRVPTGGDDGFFAKSWLNLDNTNNYIWLEGTYHYNYVTQQMNGYKFVINNKRETAYWPDGWGMTSGSFYSSTGYWSCSDYKNMKDDGYILAISKSSVRNTFAMKREVLPLRCERM